MSIDELSLLVGRVAEAVTHELIGETLSLNDLCKVMLTATTMIITEQTDGQITNDRALELLLNYRMEGGNHE